MIDVRLKRAYAGFSLDVDLNLPGRGVTAPEVLGAINAANFLAAPGKTKGEYVSYSITMDTTLRTPEAFAALPVRADGDAVVRLGDVARVELAAASNDTIVNFNGEPGTFIGIFPTPGANPLDMSAAVLAECRRRGIVTLGAATSIAEAQALEAAGVDLMVATGAEAGGHRPSFLASAEASLMGTFPLVQLVSRRVRLPVIAAGGIADARGVRAALELGAQAVQMGTAFLACEESGTTEAHRALLFSERSESTTLTRAFTGRLARGLRNRWTEELASRSADLPPFPITSWFVSKLRPAAVAAGRTDLVSLWSGQIAPDLRHRTATDLMRSLLSELYPHPQPEEVNA